jgi:hypothetical protein
LDYPASPNILVIPRTLTAGFASCAKEIIADATIIPATLQRSARS